MCEGGGCRVAREMVREAAKVWKGLRPKTWAVADSTRSCADDRGSSGGVEARRTLTTATVAELQRQSNHLCRRNERALLPSSYTLVFLSLAVLYFKHKHSSTLFSFCFVCPFIYILLVYCTGQSWFGLLTE